MEHTNLAYRIQTNKKDTKTGGLGAGVVKASRSCWSASSIFLFRIELQQKSCS